MRVLLTGASGFIGNHLHRYLLVQRHEVDALSHKDADITDRQQFRERCSSQYDVILHLAADMPVTRGVQSDSIMLNNTLMAQHVMELAKEQRCQVVYASSSALYGNPRREHLPVGEDYPLDIETLYATGKRLGEIICLQYAYEYSLPVVVLRLSAPYGKGMNPHAVVTKFIRNALLGNELVLHATGDRSQDFTYVGDIVRAFELAMERGKTGIYNIGTGVSTSMRKLAETVLDVVRGTGSILSCPGVDDLQANYHMAVDIRKARQELGFEPLYDLRRGIEDYVKQQRS